MSEPAGRERLLATRYLVEVAEAVSLTFPHWHRGLCMIWKSSVSQEDAGSTNVDEVVVFPETRRFAGLRRVETGYSFCFTGK